MAPPTRPQLEADRAVGLRRLGVAVAGKVGRAVLLFPADERGVPDPRAVHQGLPVGDNSVKWLGTLWLRQRPTSHLAEGQEG